MLKGKFLSKPVLQIPDPNKPFILETDKLKFASEEYSDSRIRKNNSIHVDTSHKNLIQQKKTTRYMIESYSQLSEVCEPGDTFFRDHPPKQLLSATTRTCSSIGSPRN